MRTLSSAQTLEPATRAGPGPVAATHGTASAASAGGARPGLDVLRAPPDAPIQRVTFARFTGRRRLWNWSYNDHENRILSRERQARESVESLNDFAAHPVYGAQVAALRQRLATHRAATVDDGGYAGHQSALDTLHEDSERLSYGITAHLHHLQQGANAAADALHLESLQAHDDIQTHGMNPARLDALDDIQRRHTALMTHVHQHNLDLPVPDRDTLSAGAHNQIQSDWRALSRTQNVVSVANGTTPELDANLRSMHARLLSRPNGRALMRELVSTSARGPLQVRRDAPDAADRAARLQRVTNRDDLDRAGAALDLREQHYDGLLRALNARKASNEEVRAVGLDFAREVGGPRQALAQRYPEGTLEPPSPGAAGQSGFDMSLRQGVRDSEFLNDGELGHGMARPNIASPAFVIYGHEIVHAMRRRRNIREADGHIAGWGNREERETINGAGAGGVTENAIRNEHRIPRREHHTSRPREAAGF